jgi:CubicO group peptidase (beta-lactamase class C family)
MLQAFRQVLPPRMRSESPERSGERILIQTDSACGLSNAANGLAVPEWDPTRKLGAGSQELGTRSHDLSPLSLPALGRLARFHLWRYTLPESISRRRFAIGGGAVACAAVLGRADLLAAESAPHQDDLVEPPWDLATMLAIAGVPGMQQATAGRASAKVVPYLGVADAEANSAVDAETVFESASLSKPTVAYLTLLMADRGRLELDAPIRDYIAESPVPDDPRGDRITIRHVLSHSSGLQNWRFRAGDQLRLAFDPGERFSYSGEGFVLLQRVLEQRTNTAFSRLIREELFEPLGMRRASFIWTAALEPNIARPHGSRGTAQNSFGQRLGRELAKYAASRQPAVTAESLRYPELVAAAAEIDPERPPFPNFFVPNAAASLLSTASDYARFAALLIDDASAPPALRLRSATRQAMRTPQVRLAPGLAWGLGIGLEERQGDTLFWHWGDNGGYKNFVVVDPRGQRARVVFTNGSGGLKVAERLLREEYGDLASLLWV